MKRVQGSATVKLLECVNPVKNKWRVRWDVQTEDGGLASYMEEEFAYRPAEEEIKALIISWQNEQTDEKILKGFVYQGEEVWLSPENQFNYKAAYDLAVQTEGKTLPVTFKFGTDEEPIYHEFATLEELADFYTKAMNHVQTSLEEGWKKKENINLTAYGNQSDLRFARLPSV